jgi:hypothetical protein
MIDTFKDKVLRLVSAPEICDGIEIVAMSVTIEMLTTTHMSGSGSNREAKYEVDIVGSVLAACKSTLLERLGEFINAQVVWIKQCKEDPKKSGVLLPFAKFPAFVDQILEFAGDKVNINIIFCPCVVICNTFIFFLAI